MRFILPTSGNARLSLCMHFYRLVTFCDFWRLFAAPRGTLSQLLTSMEACQRGSTRYAAATVEGVATSGRFNRRCDEGVRAVFPAQSTSYIC